MTLNETLNNQYEGFQAEFYDIMHTDSSDINFYIEMVKKTDGNCLEIGSGTGRILIPVARAGYKIGS
ncbi:MAG: hypothetical protein HY796_08850 [Elusimicrobia bacterium]|nr:hypothetical protein [Elusimicrobiota bacterium]